MLKNQISGWRVERSHTKKNGGGSCAYKNYTGMHRMQAAQLQHVPDYPVVDLDKDSVDLLRNKFEIKRGLSPEERFPIVSKRARYMEKAMISSYAFVLVLGTELRVRPKEGDGRAVLRVNEKKFYTSMDLSGKPVSINDFLQIPYGNQCLSEWGKYCG